MQLEGFTNISEALRSGVYALCAKDRVIYIGKSKCMLVRIYSHRNAKSKKGALPSWFPIKGITFDEVHVRLCHPDQIDQLEFDMINLYKPKDFYYGMVVSLTNVLSLISSPEDPKPEIKPSDVNLIFNYIHSTPSLF